MPNSSWKDASVSTQRLRSSSVLSTTFLLSPTVVTVPNIALNMLTTETTCNIHNDSKAYLSEVPGVPYSCLPQDGRDLIWLMMPRCGKVI